MQVRTQCGSVEEQRRPEGFKCLEERSSAGAVREGRAGVEWSRGQNVQTLPQFFLGKLSARGLPRSHARDKCKNGGGKNALMVWPIMPSGDRLLRRQGKCIQPHGLPVLKYHEYVVMRGGEHQHLTQSLFHIHGSCGIPSNCSPPIVLSTNGRALACSTKYGQTPAGPHILKEHPKHAEATESNPNKAWRPKVKLAKATASSPMMFSSMIGEGSQQPKDSNAGPTAAPRHPLADALANLAARAQKFEKVEDAAPCGELKQASNKPLAKCGFMLSTFVGKDFKPATAVVDAAERLPCTSLNDDAPPDAAAPSTTAATLPTFRTVAGTIWKQPCTTILDRQEPPPGVLPRKRSRPAEIESGPKRQQLLRHHGGMSLMVDRMIGREIATQRTGFDGQPVNMSMTMSQTATQVVV